MGRKIPGRKHRGVKDPAKQQAVRFNKIKHKINAPPTEADDVYMPKSLQRVVDLKNRVKEGKIPVKLKRRKRKSDKLIVVKQPAFKQIEGGQRPEKPVPSFKQKPGESDDQFLFRVSSTCRSLVKESKFEDKYKVDVQRNKETGNVEGVVKRPRDVLDENKAKKAKLSKWQKRKIKLQAKKEETEQVEDEKEWPTKEEIKFGDIAHQPPTLKAPRRAENVGTPRPGKKDLLLQNMLGNNNNLSTTDKKTIDRTSKRKNLPKGLRSQLEKQRDELVNAYKLLKAQKQSGSV